MPDIKKIKLGSTTYDIVDGTHKNIIILEDNGSAAAGTWLAKTNRISAYEDGQLFIYRVTVAGASSTTLNVTGANGSALGARGVFRGSGSSSKLTTQYAVGSQILLYFCKPKSTDDGYFVTINDYPADNDKKTASGNTSSKIFLIGATTQSSSGQATYSHDTAYVGTDGCLYSGGTKVSIVGHNHDIVTLNTAPESHTHDYVVNGTTGSNSGTAVAAATAIGVKSSSSAAPGGHTHAYDKTTGVTLTANAATATGRITYVESITDTPPTLGGTTTFVTGVNAGSGSLKSYNASSGGTAQTSSGRVPYVHSITAGSASGTGSNTAAPIGHTHSYSKNTYTISGNQTSHTTKYLSLSTSAAGTGTVTINGGSGSLNDEGTAANGVPFVAAQGTFSAGTTPVSSASFSGTKTNALVTGATTKYIHFSAGSLPTLTLTEKKPHKITGWSAGTTPPSSATVNYLSTATTGANSGTSGTLASYSAGVFTINKTVNSGSHSHTYDKTSSITLNAGTAPSLTYEEVAINSGSGWSAGSLPSVTINTTSTNAKTSIITAVAKGDYTPGGSISLTRGTAPSLGDATIKYLKHSHTGATLGGTTTFATSGLASVTLNSSTTSSTGSQAYVASMTNSSIGLTKGSESANTAATTASAVPTISGVSYTAPTATTYYLEHIHNGASASGTGTVTISGGTTASTTKYLSATPTHTSTNSAANSGTNFNAATAIQITNTSNVAPSGHTHSYGSSQALTTATENEDPVAAVIEVKASTN